MPVSYDALVELYDRYTGIHLDIEVIEHEGICSDPWLEELIAERKTIWASYVERGGWEPALHSGAPAVSPDRTPDGRAMLRRGSRGNTVEELQNLIGIDPDGLFGSETDARVREFQQDVGMTVDGIVGPNTWRAILHPHTPAGNVPTSSPSDPRPEHDVCTDGDNVLTLPPADIEWDRAEAWCGETVVIEGMAEDLADGDSVQIEVLNLETDSPIEGVMAAVVGGKFAEHWSVREAVLETRTSPMPRRVRCGLAMDGLEAATPLSVRQLVQLNATSYTGGRHHFTIAINEGHLDLTSEVKFVAGWAASVDKLGGSVPAGTGGLLDGQLAWPGYRWMRHTATGHEYWNRTAWAALPRAFRLIDASNFCVGFYKAGANYVCQYGGNWPTPADFSAWNPADPAKRKKLSDWEQEIDKTWSGKFDIRRVGCGSTNDRCCRLPVGTTVRFQQQASFSADNLIIADGNIRSNDALFFLGDPRLAMAAHEFGHHIGNPDEYAGARVDTSLNSDGAVNGIDPNSIMGQNLTTVKNRHFRLICKHLADMVKTQRGKTFSYEAVPP